MITSWTSTPVPNLVAVSLAGASPHICEILRCCAIFFVVLSWFFSRTRARVEPLDGFSRLMAQTTRAHPYSFQQCVCTGGGAESEAYYPQWRRINQSIERPSTLNDSLIRLIDGTCLHRVLLKVGFHYPSSRAELTARELGCIF